MAGSVNKVILVGNVGRDPEVRTTQAGTKIANFTLATSESWNDRASGERKERTEWHRIVVYNEQLATIAEKYLRKGSKVYVEGQLQTRKWTDQSGQEKYTTEVVLNQFKATLTMLGDPPQAGGSRATDSNERSQSNGKIRLRVNRGRIKALARTTDLTTRFRFDGFPVALIHSIM